MILKVYSSVALVASLCFQASIAFASYLHQVPFSSPVIDLQGSTLRNATLRDVDAVAEVLVAAFANDEASNYLWQFRDQYPDDQRTCMRKGVVQIIEGKGALLQVIDMPSKDDPSIRRPVAAAFWRLPPSIDQGLLRLFSNCAYRSLNITRAIDWDHKLVSAKRKYFDERYGSEHLYLDIIGTHPDYQRQGAATQLVVSGLDTAKTHGVVATLIATMAGEPVYRNIGFESVANITITTVDEDRGFPFDVMFYNVSRHARS